MVSQSLFGFAVLLLTGMATYQGFRQPLYFERHAFEVDGILIGKQYDRLFSSGFLHVDWLHFAFNMGALLAFSVSLEQDMGVGRLALLYLASLLGGSLLALYIHRMHGDYRAVGASGAVSGVILASAIQHPFGGIGIPGIPYYLDSWIFALAFMLLSIIGIKTKADNIGHEAHLGGAITGIVLMVAFEPTLLATNWWIILPALLIPAAFLFIIIRNPEFLIIPNYWGRSPNRQNRTTKPSSKSTLSPSQELDQLLEKIQKSGINSLSKRERQRLEELSQK